jgi:hypothetical protein
MSPEDRGGPFPGQPSTAILSIYHHHPYTYIDMGMVIMLKRGMPNHSQMIGAVSITSTFVSETYS